MPSFKCNYPDDRESRERNEKIAFVPAILGSLIPLGFSMPVAWKWPLWAVSLISVVYLALAFIPFLARLANGQKFFIGLAAMSAAIAAFWPVISQQWRAEKSAYVEGDFEPPRKAATLLNLEIGNSGSVIVIAPHSQLNLAGPPVNLAGPNGLNIGADQQAQGFRILYNAGLSIEIENGELLLTTPVRDREGHLVANIVRNHWSVTNSCLDKNYTSDSLEVLDARGLVIFQVKLLPDRIQLQGEWRDEFGHGIRLVADKAGKGSSLTIWKDAQSELQYMQIITPMFKYPSRNHWGEHQ